MKARRNATDTLASPTFELSTCTCKEVRIKEKKCLRTPDANACVHRTFESTLSSVGWGHYRRRATPGSHKFREPLHAGFNDNQVILSLSLSLRIPPSQHSSDQEMQMPLGFWIENNEQNCRQDMLLSSNTKHSLPFRQVSAGTVLARLCVYVFSCVLGFPR